MTDVEIYIDPSCPWAWITSRWLLDVAPERDLTIVWRSYCLEIRDDYGVAPTVPDQYRQQALDGHAVSHRMLRIFEAARAAVGEDAVGRLYSEWGARNFASERPEPDALLADCVKAAGLPASLTAAADDDRWDAPIRDAMEVAYTFGGPKTQTPTIVVRTDPPHGFKGPVMAPAPTGPDAVRFWDAIQVLSEQQGFFEINRPRRNLPRLHLPDSVNKATVILGP
jgi:2-hydroxychromene-2-carboxylate isomerase